MAQEYISYIQTETIFKALPTIKAIEESLNVELQRLEQMAPREINDLIETQAIGNKAPTGLPPSSNISDTTGNIALSYSKKIEQEIAESIEKIKEEKLFINIVDDKLEIAIKRLTPIQKQILILFYWENKTWAETLEELKEKEYYITKRNAQLTRRCGIEKIQSISKITIDTYEKVMRLVEVE